MDKKPLPALGIHEGLPETEYHSSPGISKHGLDLVVQSGMHYKQQRHEETKALIYGGAFHCLILEPDTFEGRYTVSQYPDFRKKEAREWKQEQIDAGRRVISAAEYEDMNRMADKIREHEKASILLDPDQGRAELSAYWIDNNLDIWRDEEPTGRLCRCRPDFINEAHDIVIDLKTTECAGYSKFSKQVTSYRYHVQDAFYRDGLRQAGVKVKLFAFVAIEKKPPYGIGCYYLDPRAIHIGREEWKRAMRLYDKYMTSNEWDGYPADLRELELPKFAEYQDYY